MRLFAAVALPTLLAMLFSVALVSASLDVDGKENLNERYVFYVAPILFVGFALWIEERLPRPYPWAGAIVAVCAVLTIVLPIGRLEYNAAFQSVALLPWLGHDVSRIALAVVVGGFTLGCGVLWLRNRTDRVGRLLVLTGSVMAITGLLAIGASSANATWASRASTASTGRGSTRRCLLASQLR